MIGIKTGGSKPPLFCVSPRTVDVLAYRDLALKLGDEQPFYALYAIDMPNQTSGLSPIEHAARTFIEDVRSVSPSGPYQLGGYSQGGLVALEMARQLRMEGESVKLVALLDVYGPDYRKMKGLLPRSLYRPLQALRNLQKSIEEFPPWLIYHLGLLKMYSWSNRVQYIQLKGLANVRWRLNRLKRRGMRLKDRTRSVGSDFFTFERSYRNYRPEPYDGRVILFRAARQPLGIRPDPVIGWRSILTGELEVHQIPGYHDSILFSPRLDTLASLLKDALA